VLAVVSMSAAINRSLSEGQVVVVVLETSTTVRCRNTWLHLYSAGLRLIMETHMRCFGQYLVCLVDVRKPLESGGIRFFF